MAKHKNSSKRDNEPEKVGANVLKINKSRTSLGMKIVLIFVAVALVVGFIAGAGSLLTPANTVDMNGNANSSTDASGTAGTAKTVKEVDAQFKPEIDALEKTVAKDPTNYPQTLALANGCFDYAQALSQLDTTDQATAAAASAMWTKAADAYKKAVSMKYTDASQTDWSIAQFYSGDVANAIKNATAVTQKNPKFAQAWLNLGYFQYENKNNTAAKTALNTYLTLDPNNQYGGQSNAKQILSQIGS